jgi:twinkle protein
VVGLERDQQGKNPNVATVRILKNRTVGETGVAGKIVYDPETTMLNEYDDTFDNGDDDEEEI